MNPHKERPTRVIYPLVGLLLCLNKTDSRKLSTLYVLAHFTRTHFAVKAHQQEIRLISHHPHTQFALRERKPRSKPFLWLSTLLVLVDEQDTAR